MTARERIAKRADDLKPGDLMAEPFNALPIVDVERGTGREDGQSYKSVRVTFAQSLTGAPGDNWRVFRASAEVSIYGPAVVAVTSTQLLPLPMQADGWRYTPGQVSRMATGYNNVAVRVLQQVDDLTVVVQFLEHDLDLDVLAGEVSVVGIIRLIDG